MDKIEEVKKIIRKDRTGVTVTRNESANFINYPNSVAGLAKQINRLYEPHGLTNRPFPPDNWANSGVRQLKEEAPEVKDATE